MTDIYNIIAVVLTLTAVFSYLNHRFAGLPTTIGVMFTSLSASLVLVLCGWLQPEIKEFSRELIVSLHFDRTVLHGMLGYLLFAGALHVNINDLYANRWAIASLATVGTILSTGIVASLTWLVTLLLGIDLPVIYCLLFGALISPTDPIAVLGILKSARIPRSLEAKFSGESLFNDGIGVVLFLLLLESVTAEGPSGGLTLLHAIAFFIQEAIGGALFGMVIGYAAYRMLRKVDNAQVEILITLALASGGYALASTLHLSGPIAIVVAGLFVGNHGRLFAMSDKTRERIDIFWELVDEVLNAVLFVLIGLEALAMAMEGRYLTAGIISIPVVLIARCGAVVVPIAGLKVIREFSPGAMRLLIWGGLRGGISVALALSLPQGAPREILLTMTYCVVVFSILVQGLTIGPLAQRLRN